MNRVLLFFVLSIINYCCLSLYFFGIVISFYDFILLFNNIAYASFIILVLLVIPFVLMHFLLFLGKKIVKFNFNFTNRYRYISTAAVILFCNLLFFVYDYYQVEEFIRRSDENYSDFYETHYVDPKQAEISAPYKKKNLILVFMESMEKNYSDPALFDGVNLIPHLSQLAFENISFEKFYQLEGSYWTIGGLVGVTSGVSLIKLAVAVNINENNDVTPIQQSLQFFLPGAYTLAEFLKENGYETLFVQGGDIDFAGQKNYLEQHGFAQENIWGAEKIEKNNYSFKKDENWWGYDDRDTYSVFKEKILSMSKDKPFMAVMMTLDTHPEYHLDKRAEKKFDDDLSNTVYDSSVLMEQFVRWVQAQPFGDDTVIVIVGDHLVQHNHYLARLSNKQRYCYNVFINSQKKVTNKNRAFTHLDMYPTIIESLGFNIKGGRLALGTSLFSDVPTLTEKYGIKNFSDLIKQKNKLYDRLFLTAE